MSFVFRYPGRMAAALFLTGCGGAIAWNALVLQQAHHPAPLFSQRELPPYEIAPAPEPEVYVDQPLPPARPNASTPDAHPFFSPEPQAATPAPAQTVAAPRPPVRSGITNLIRNGGEAAPARNAPPAPAAPARARTVRDPIGEIIRMGGPVPMPPANVGRTDPGDLVLAGQRALARLGYGVTVDGIMGSETRQAIQRFEQDRNLPVTGQLNGRTARELSTLSGIPVQ